MPLVDETLVDDDSTDPGLTDQVHRYREVRETLERIALPRATSVDGRTFELQASLHDLELRRGGYVALGSGEVTRLGQLTELASHQVTADVGGPGGSHSGVVVRLAVGSGLLLDRGQPFHDAHARPAGPDEVAAWLARTKSDRAVLTVGELLLAPGVPAELDSGGLGRHTFLCGQSGSGKTYALGLLLERVLAETTLPVVVLDPNSDHVNLGRLRPDADPGLGARYRKVIDGVEVWGNGPGQRPLRLRFDELDARTQTAVLGLDPLLDAEEYSALVDLLAARERGRPLITGLSQLLEAASDGTRRLGTRARNLGITEWSLWSHDEPSLLAEIAAPSARCVVVDLGSLPTMAEQRLVSDAVLAALWARRHDRSPVILVIDEAHNICSSTPIEPLSRLSTERTIQVAAEGRKYGLYLLVSTQRPGKVHEEIVSQCDNLVLMRMNAASDLHEIERLFSFVPPGLIAGASGFAMGQALVSGRIFPPGACYVQMGARVAEEGGADVPATWARARGG